MLHQIRIASPCSADWEQMKGDDQVRFCAQCNLNVYNFSEMREKDILQLLTKKEGRICGRFYQRADGTMLTKNCPTGFRAQVRRVSRIAGAALSAAMSVGVAFAQVVPKNSPSQTARRTDSRITINVQDRIGAVIVNANILLSAQTKRMAEGITDNRGQLLFSALPADSYTATIQSPGFETQTVPVKTWPSENTTLTVAMRVATSLNMGVIVLSDSDIMNLPQQDLPDVIK